MLKVILSGLCVLATASPLFAGITAANIAGRWQGDSWAQNSSGPLTLDIVACGTGWCGIKVEAGDKCGGTALKLDSGEALADSDYIQFKGTLQLAARHRALRGANVNLSAGARRPARRPAEAADHR